MRHPFRLFLAALALSAAGLYALAQSALSDLDRIVQDGGAEGAPTDPLPAAKSWALFLTAQILPLRQPGAATVQAGRTFRDCPDCPELVEIPAGYFLIGSPLVESGRHQHFFGRTPVYRQFRFLNREAPYDHAPRPRLILLDINLPRKSGIEVLAELRADAELRRTVVFVMTTSRADEDRLAAYDLNVAGYLVKNQLPEAFLASLQMLDRYWNVVMLP